ncbi:MAG: hypothetical protein V1726_03525 [Methanobacteriota archaeon]
MNRESAPLLIAILVPFIIVGVILLYFYGYDITVFLKKINIIYYVILIPFALGLFAALLKIKKE